MELLKLEQVREAVILKRPSKNCKTPYVADIQLEDKEFMGHCPSLGCCGHADASANVIVVQLPEKKKQTCTHRVELAIIPPDEKDDAREIVIGINPKLAETLVEEAIKLNYIKDLQHVKKYAREVKFLNSRFDFCGIDQNGKKFILEVKNVPLADYVDVPKKEKKNYKEEMKNKKFNEKISYFPDGYRKNSKDVVSPRALKHIQELEELAKNENIRAILCFVIQRNDVTHFQTSNVDLIYKQAVLKASQNGVEITVLQVEWNKEGSCKFVSNDLPIILN